MMKSRLLRPLLALISIRFISICLLSEAFWTHHAAPARSPLVARPRADTVPPLCSDVPLSQRHSSVLPRWQYQSGSWRRGPPSPALVSHSNSDCPARQAINPGRPIILCRRSTGMEQSAVSRTGCIVAHHLPTITENISLSLEFSGPLVANSMLPPMLYAGTSLTV